MDPRPGAPAGHRARPLEAVEGTPAPVAARLTRALRRRRDGCRFRRVNRDRARPLDLLERFRQGLVENGELGLEDLDL